MIVDIFFSFVENATFILEGYPSGQREQTVNLPALPSQVRILPPPFFLLSKAGVVQW